MGLGFHTHGYFIPITYTKVVYVWLGGRVVRTLDLQSIDREFESWPLHYQVQLWASSIIWFQPMGSDALQLGR